MGKEREEGEDEKSFGMVMKVLERGNEEMRKRWRTSGERGNKEEKRREEMWRNKMYDDDKNMVEEICPVRKRRIRKENKRHRMRMKRLLLT